MATSTRSSIIKVEKRERGRQAAELLTQLRQAGVKDPEIAHRIESCVQSLIRWRSGEVVPSPLYFKALKEFAEKKGVTVKQPQKH